MKKIKRVSGFTLVELIVVVVILAVLAVISFLTISGWIGKSKDSKRLSDLKSIQNSIEIRRGEKGEIYYPFPDIPITISTNNNGVLWYQGKVGTGLVNRMGTMNKKVIDPKGNQYEYSISADKKYYQITAYLENDKQVGILYEKVYAQDMYAYILTNYQGYIIAQEDGGKYTLLQTDSIQIDPSKISTNISGDVYKTNLQNEIVDNGTNIFTSAVTGDVTNLFDGIDSNNYATLQAVDTQFASITSPEQAGELIKVASGNPNNTTIEAIAANCVGITYSGYTYDSILHGANQTKTKSVTISNGTGTKSMTATCNNGTLIYGVESLSLTCNSGYVESAGSCVADVCQGTLPANAQLNGTQSVAGTWEYSTTSGVCKFQCDTNYTRNGSICLVDTRTNQSCSGLPSNAIWNTASTISQTWNGTTWLPTTVGTYNTSASTSECRYKCDTNYTWNGSSCFLNNYFTGNGTVNNPYRLSFELSGATSVTSTSCNYYNVNSFTNNLGTIRGSGSCYGGKECLTDGIYLIDPDGSGGSNAFKVYCDMTLQLGGWTRLLLNAPNMYNTVRSNTNGYNLVSDSTYISKAWFNLTDYTQIKFSDMGGSVVGGDISACWSNLSFSQVIATKGTNYTCSLGSISGLTLPTNFKINASQTVDSCTLTALVTNYLHIWDSGVSGRRYGIGINGTKTNGWFECLPTACHVQNDPTCRSSFRSTQTNSYLFVR